MPSAACSSRSPSACIDEDIETNKRIGGYGRPSWPMTTIIITHCNAGSIATAGYGTAEGVMRAAVEAGKKIHVYVDETRPVLQGARLTAWELMQENIPCTLITDNMAGYFMYRDMIDLAIVGADRIAANGDVANKIGTYGLAVLCKEHGIPFYVAAPLSTIDFTMESGVPHPHRRTRSPRGHPCVRQGPDRARRCQGGKSGLRCDAGPVHNSHHHRKGRVPSEGHPQTCRWVNRSGKNQNKVTLPSWSG